MNWSNLIFQIGHVLCQKANFVGLVSIKFTEASGRQAIGGANVLSPQEQATFSQCLTVYLVCNVIPNQS